MINEKVVNLLKSNKLSISTAESVTGGKIISQIIEIPGASNITEESYVVYSNNAKIKVLGVDKSCIDKNGVVSEQLALEMAEKLKSITGSDIAISTTGEAGPITNELNISIGTVCFGLIIGKDKYTFTKKFTGDRISIINQSVTFILNQLYGILKDR